MAWTARRDIVTRQMGLDDVTWPAWQSADHDMRASWREQAAARVGGTLHGDSIEVRGLKLVLIPGGRVDLGWDGRTLALDPVRRAEWEADADFDGSFESFLRTFLGSARTVSISPFLIEPIAVSISELGIDPYGDDPETALRQAIEDSGFRLPTNDEWEVAMRAGAATLFPWGEAWPEGAGPTTAEAHRGSTAFLSIMEPNALGIALRTSSYETEVVAERDWLRAGDGGTAVCGRRPAPEPWYSYALAFQWPREAWAEVVAETLEQAFVRRTLSLTQAKQT